MSTQNMIFYVRNPARRPEFQIETKIVKKSSSYIVQKNADSTSSIDHVNKMVQSHEALVQSKKFASQINILKPTKTGNGQLEFNYIKGTSLERKLLNSLLSGDDKTSILIINKLFRIISGLPVKELNPTDNVEYRKVLGNSFNKVQKCVSPGVIDLNLDNVIVDDNDGWNLFDVEWVFPFAIPIELQKVRLLWYFLSRHAESIELHSERIPTLKHSRSDLYVPEFMYKKYKSELSFLGEFSKSEKAFQEYATDNHMRELELISKGEFKPIIPRKTDKMTELFDIYADKKMIKEYPKLISELEKTQNENKRNSEKLNDILNSKTYRFARKMEKIKRSIHIR